MTNKDAADILRRFLENIITCEGRGNAKSFFTMAKIEALNKAVMALEKQDDNNWIYNPLNEPEWDSKFKEIEKALGFELFFWQKTYIARGEYRLSGRTTAGILRDLLFDVDAEPIDYYKNPPKDRMRQDYDYMFCFRDIKRKLDVAGIKTRSVFFCKADKERHDIDMLIKKGFDEIDGFSNFVQIEEQKYEEFLFECLAAYGITKENLRENAHRIGASFDVNGVSYFIDNSYAFTIKIVLKHNGINPIVEYEKVI